jgi:glycosyltransferase involved in cell wall biosynthesis
MQNDKIFVQLASYRDPQLVPTMRDALKQAARPENLIFGICWQKDDSESLEEFADHPQVRYQVFNYTESQGLGWARNKVAELWEGEPYTLQLDSHHRFEKDWDIMMIEDYIQALTMSDNPIISTYLSPFDVLSADECRCNLQKLPSLMSQYEFSSDKLLMSMPWYIQDWKERDTVIRARTISGHFYFVDSKFIKDVPYDPDIYFGGYTEETTMSVRAWTSGYDFFSPYRPYIWHEYTRRGRPKHWEDHGTKSETNKTSGERDVFARQKTRQLFDQEDNGIDLAGFGLGTVRTLREYELFTGVDFKNQRIQDYTLKVNEPPNSLPWDEGFITNKYDVSINWDIEFFKNLQFKKPKFLTLGVLTKSDVELYRHDFQIETQPQYVNLENNQFTVNIQSIDKPSKIVMYLFDEEQGWSPRYEKLI